MDQETQARLDSLVEDELQRGFRVCTLPVELQRMLVTHNAHTVDKEKKLPEVKRARFSAVNPGRRRDINQTVQQRYHRDLKDEAIMSDAEVLKLVERRGEWTGELTARMYELQSRTTTELALLWNDGYRPDTSTWRADLLDVRFKVAEAVEKSELTDEQRERYLRVLARFAEYRANRKDEYTGMYAEDQELADYSVDRDHNFLMDNAPSLEDVDRVNEIAELRDRIERLEALNLERFELAALQDRYARIFAGTAESRQRATEEMAALYFTCDIVGENDVPLGRLATSFDGMWEYPQEVLSWLMTESHFFHNNVPAETRDMLDAFSFRRAGRDSRSSSGESAPSDESLAPQSSNSGGASAAETPSESSASSTATS
jgi:hypothetical protein